MARSLYGTAQPPWANPSRVSSSGRPGPCITPSSVTQFITTTLPMPLLRSLQRHRQERLELGDRLRVVLKDDRLHPDRLRAVRICLDVIEQHGAFGGDVEPPAGDVVDLRIGLQAAFLVGVD